MGNDDLQASGNRVRGGNWGKVGTKVAPSRHQVQILRNCQTEKAIGTLMASASRKDRTKFRNQVLKPLLQGGWLEMTVRDKPTSSKQKYRLTDKGRQLLAELVSTPVLYLTKAPV